MGCGELLEHGDVIRAEIITKFIALKSKIAYAMEKPKECTYVEHVSCDNPQGDPNNDIDPYFPNVGD